MNLLNFLFSLFILCNFQAGYHFVTASMLPPRIFNCLMDPKIIQKIRFLTLCASLMCCAHMPVFPQDTLPLPPEIPLWPGGIKNNPIVYGRDEEVRYISPLPGSISGRARVVSFVSAPAYTLYRVPDSLNTGIGLVICPGGAYRFLSLDMEGHDMAMYFQRRGITSLVLKYRTNTPQGPDQTRFDFETYIPEVVKDGRKAVQLLRDRSHELGLDPGKIGMMGCSAGGHLTIKTALSGSEDAGMDAAADGIPDFLGLIYPGIPDDLPPAPPAGFPPAFIILGLDDNAIPPEKIIGFYRYLLRAGQKPELHMYSKGPHGRGMSADPMVGRSMRMWPESFLAWIRDVTEKKNKSCTNHVLNHNAYKYEKGIHVIFHLVAPHLNDRPYTNLAAIVFL
jgi:acetyl esterase/lipase